MSCQARGAFWLRHWSSGCWDMTICCILHDLSIEQTSQAFATEITPLAQIWHSHPLLLCCCGLRTSLNCFWITLLHEKLSFFVSRFSPEVCHTKDDRIHSANLRILSCQTPKLLRILSNDVRMQRIAVTIAKCDFFWSFSIQQLWKSTKNVIQQPHSR